MTRESWREWGEPLRALAVAVLVALLIRTFVVETFMVNGVSMKPTLFSGDRLLVDKLAYRFSKPRIGQIVILHPPVGTSCTGVGVHPPDYVKRIVAVGGETVSMRGGQVYVDGQLQPDSYVLSRYRGTTSMAPRTVPTGDVWVMGDHRDDSMDSRCFGPVPVTSLVGQVMLVWWPLGLAHTVRP